MATIDNEIQYQRVCNLYAPFAPPDRITATQRTRGARWAFVVQALLVASVLSDVLAPRCT